MVPVNLRGLVGAAADLYSATGNGTAMRAAELIRSATPRAVADPPQALPILAHLRSVAVPQLATGADMVRLPWTNGSFALPAAIRGRNAYAELVGPEGPLFSPHCRFGFYLQAPDCLYPAHSHAAEELYLLLSGSAEWQLDDSAAFISSSPGLVHHLPWQTHAMRTGPSPLLALWVWLGDISYATYSI